MDDVQAHQLPEEWSFYMNNGYGYMWAPLIIQK